MALAGWFLHGQPLIIAMMVLMFLFGLFMGTQRVVFGVLMAKVIPLSRRGRLQAWRNATGSLIAAALAYAAGKYIIKADLLGNGFSPPSRSRPSSPPAGSGPCSCCSRSPSRRACRRGRASGTG